MSRWAGSSALLYLGEPRVSVPRGFSNNNWVPTWLALTQILKLAGAAILIALAAATIPHLLHSDLRSAFFLRAGRLANARLQD